MFEQNRSDWQLLPERGCRQFILWRAVMYFDALILIKLFQNDSILIQSYIPNLLMHLESLVLLMKINSRWNHQEFNFCSLLWLKKDYQLNLRLLSIFRLKMRTAILDEVRIFFRSPDSTNSKKNSLFIFILKKHSTNKRN